MPMSRSGFKALANAVWNLVAVASRTVTVADKTGFSLAADQPVNTTKIAGTTTAAVQPGYFPGDTVYHRATLENVLVGGRRDVHVSALDGSTLAAHTAGQFPSDIRGVDNVNLATHAAGQLPSDLRSVAGNAVAGATAGYAPGDTFYHRQQLENNLVSGRRDVSVGTVQNDAISAAGFSQGAADKVWGSATRTLSDKSGFTLVAGSYSVRASGVQKVSFLVSDGSQDLNVTISSATASRTTLNKLGATGPSTVSDSEHRMEQTSDTNVYVFRIGSTTNLTGRFEVLELY